MIRVLLVDDHAVLREGLRQLLAVSTDILAVAEAANGGEAFDRLRAGGIDVIVLDLTLPGICGEDLIERLRVRHPAQPILVLSMHNAPQIALGALKAGASGYLTKDQCADMLLGAIRKIAAGGRFIDPALAEQFVFRASGNDPLSGHELLTGREFQVLRLLAGGANVNDIAARLAISNKTVSTYKSRLMERMGFSSTADLIRYALKHHLAD